MLTYGSLFSGIGGFDLGFDRAGMKCEWQVEIDDKAHLILNNHWPNVEKFTDVRQCGRKNLRPVDLICGGFPCQDISVAGKREGLAGERSGLWFEFHRIIAELKPQFVVIENVAGLLSSNERRDFAVVLGGLTGIVPAVPKKGWGNAGLARGPIYNVAYRVLDSQFFGVPQRRRRVFIVGSLGNGRATEVLFEREGSAWDTAPSREAGQRVAGTLDVKSASSNRGSQANETDFLACTPGDFGTYKTGLGTLRAEGGDYGGGSEMLIANTLNKSGRYNPETETFIATTFNASGAGTDRPGGQGAEPGFYVPNEMGVRRLTPTECERLQGFPEIEGRTEICLDHQENYVSVEIRNRKSPRPVGSAGSAERKETVSSVVKNLPTKNQQISKPAQERVHISCGERGAEILNLKKLPSYANNAEKKNKYHHLIESEDFALQLALMNTTLDQITQAGRVELRVKGQNLIVQKDGNGAVNLSGSAMTQLVKGATNDTITAKGLLKFTISGHTVISRLDTDLITSSFYVLAAISGCIRTKTESENSFKIDIDTKFGWTFGQSDSARYRQLGNAVTVNVIEWIGKRIERTL